VGVVPRRVLGRAPDPRGGGVVEGREQRAPLGVAVGAHHGHSVAVFAGAARFRGAGRGVVGVDDGVVSGGLQEEPLRKLVLEVALPLGEVGFERVCAWGDDGARDADVVVVAAEGGEVGEGVFGDLRRRRLVGGRVRVLLDGDRGRVCGAHSDAAAGERR
jgi:hypothetical protein